MIEPRVIYTLTRGDSIGLTIAAESGLISLTAVSLVFCIMFRNIYLQIRTNPKTWRLIQEPMDLYMLSLFLAEIVQSLGAVFDIRWIERGQVVEGPFCTVQGTFQQFGETGVAMTTLVIAIHTFVAIWWRRGIHALGSAKIIMATVWLFIACFVGIGIGLNSTKDYVIPTPYWCWIGRGFLLERIFGEYIWLWLTLMFSVLTYIPLYFCSRGNIIVSDDVWWKFRIRRVKEDTPDPARYYALGLIAYPLAYSVLIIPVSIIRWIGFDQERHGNTSHVPPQAVFAGVALYGLSGAVNSVLILTTRPNLLLLKRDPFLTSNTGRAPFGVPDMNAQLSLHSQGSGPHLGRLPDLAKVEQGWDGTTVV